jgi:TPR repeat protein
MLGMSFSRFPVKALLVFSLTLPAAADFEAGLRAYQNKDYATAVKEWRPLAESGSPDAQFNLALMYLDGSGVVKNEQEAVLWFRRAADQGQAKAQKNLGNLYATGIGVRRDNVNAHMWLNLCAASGDATCVAQRDQLANKMKKKDLAEAQRRATAWKAIPEQPGKP